MTIYNLHYVGQGLYTVAQFETEAREKGVARALPARIIKTLKWGEPILLAQWQPDREKQRSYKQMKVTFGDDESEDYTEHYKRIGSANVFGFFNVTGLNMGDVPGEAKQTLVSMLKVVRVVDFGPGGMAVKRQCGSYVIGSTTFIADTLEEVMEKAAEVEKETGVRFKWFVTGPYTAIDQVTLDPAKFSRGVVKVEVDGDLLMPAGEFEPGVSFIFNYKRKLYQTKEEQHGRN